MDFVVAYLPAWLDACALYRMFLPHCFTPKSKFLFNTEALPVNDFADAKVCVVQRQCTPENMAALKRMRSMGIRIVYDLDDNLWNLPAFNPGKRIFDTMRDGFTACIEQCDALTVSTEGLQSAIRSQFPRLKQPIFVVPNAVDLDLLHPPVLPKGEGTVVGYAGTNTHVGDVNEAWAAIVDLVRGNQLPDYARFEFVGMPAPREILAHPKVRERDFVPIAEFFARFSSWAWDLSLAPLVEARFNLSKSCIKILEASAVGIPILVSPVGPYFRFTDLDPELKYLRCLSKDQWRRKIVEMIKEPERRKYYAERALAVTKKYFDIRNVAHIWMSVFESVVCS